MGAHWGYTASNRQYLNSNRGYLVAHQGAITANQSAILSNAAAIDLNMTAIAGNATDIGSNRIDIGMNQTDIRTNMAGIASAMAMAQLSEAGPGEELVLSIGGGNWEGSTAMAAGLSGRISERFSLRGSASLASGHAGVSAAMGWRIR